MFIVKSRYVIGDGRHNDGKVSYKKFKTLEEAKADIVTTERVDSKIRENILPYSNTYFFYIWDKANNKVAMTNTQINEMLKNELA